MREERWKGKTYFVQRDDKGRVISKKEKSKTYTKTKALSDLKTYGWFGDSYTIGMTELPNVIERYKYIEIKGIKRDSNGKIVSLPKLGDKPIKRDASGSFDYIDIKPLKKPKYSKSIQYYVSGVTKQGKQIYARSQTLGSPLAPDEDTARQSAWDNFFRILAYNSGKASDEDEGKQIFDRNINTMREGWVYYVKR